MLYSSFFQPEYYSLRPFGLTYTSKRFLIGTRTYLPVMLAIPDGDSPVMQWNYRLQYKGPFSYTKLYSALRSNNTCVITPFQTRQGLCFWAGKGLITEPELVRLHFLIVRNKYYFQESSLVFHRLYLSTEFTDPEGRFKLLYKKIYKDWLKRAMEEGLDVVITNDILALYQDEPQSEATDFSEEIQWLKSLPKLLYRGEQEQNDRP